MHVIGVCGGSGSGKSEVCRLFSEFNIPSIDTDALYHGMILGPCELTRALCERFGNAILDKNGAVIRKKLASIVFKPGEEQALADLNSIAHFYILNAVRERLSLLKAAGYAAALVDAPLLFESGFDRECDAVLCVTAPSEVRIARILERDGITEESARARIALQKPDAYLLQKSRYHIENAGDTKALRAQVEELARKFNNQSEV